MPIPDRHGRTVDYLRISVTDRCNLRCTYCMPAAGVTLRPREEILSYEQIERVAAAAVAEGITRIRVTGGEPLVRLGVPGLIAHLTDLVGSGSVALTTNGTLLPRHADELRRAGLERVNISLDSLDPERYERITRGGKLSEALAGVDAALDAGFSPVKVNAVATAGVVGEIDAFLALAAERPVHVRFIERMPLGETCNTSAEEEALDADGLIALIAERAHALGLGEPRPATGSARPSGWGPARYYQLEGAQGTIGVITPISRHFCEDCSRLRLTAEGTLRPCLFSAEEFSLAEALASPDDALLRRTVRDAIAARPAGHELCKNPDARDFGRHMHQIGG